MEIKKIICDQCHGDLTSAGSMPDFRLKLMAENLPFESGCVFSTYVVPPIKNDQHFCGMACLRKWLDVDTWHLKEEGSYPDSGRSVMVTNGFLLDFIYNIDEYYFNDDITFRIGKNLTWTEVKFWKYINLPRNQ
jgi:hypothetical protein